MTCNICETITSPYLTGLVLERHKVQYFCCPKCGFIQTEEPYWLNEAYESAISFLDVGLIQRNMHFAPIAETLLRKWFNEKGRFLDYGGGYGMFVRIMRDYGFNFYRQDAYCENLFAKYFDVSDLAEHKTFELITAFEVFEHLPDPVTALKHMLTYGDAILFSTQVQPFKGVKPETWWYFMMDGGQHVSLYSRQSLQTLADQFGLYYNYNEGDLHLFSKHKINNKAFSFFTQPRNSLLYNKIYGRRLMSLTPADFKYTQNLLKNKTDATIQSTEHGEDSH